MIQHLRGASGNALVASVTGDGERTALLLHGGGQTRHAWQRTARRLAQSGWRAVCVDQRGHGDSDWVESGAYTPLDFAADAAIVARTLTKKGAPRPVAIGASLGGIASLLALGIENEPPFSALVLVDIVPRMDPAGVEKIQGFMRANAVTGFASVDEAADAVALYLPHRPRPASLDGLRKNLRQREDGRWHWHWDPRFLDGPASINHDAPQVEELLVRAAKNLTIPALLVRGGASELVTPEAAEEFVSHARDAEYVDVAQAHHMVAGDRNDAFADAVVDFLGRRALPVMTGV